MTVGHVRNFTCAKSQLINLSLVKSDSSNNGRLLLSCKRIAEIDTVELRTRRYPLFWYSNYLVSFYGPVIPPMLLETVTSAFQRQRGRGCPTCFVKRYDMWIWSVHAGGKGEVAYGLRLIEVLPDSV
jgi:hypothetical protein